MGNSYNGFTWNERMAKFKEMNRRLKNGDLPHPHGPCRLCGDPGGESTGVSFEYHDEDYGQEYSWREPAAYMDCRSCHIYRIHQRSAHPESWAVFLKHVRRGGFAREMRDPAVKIELARNRAAILLGNATHLRELRPYRLDIGREWFAHLEIVA